MKKKKETNSGEGLNSLKKTMKKLGLSDKTRQSFSKFSASTEHIYYEKGKAKYAYVQDEETEIEAHGNYQIEKKKIADGKNWFWKIFYIK